MIKPEKLTLLNTIRQKLAERCQEKDIKTLLYVAMYLDPCFKKVLMLTTEMICEVKYSVFFEIRTCSMHSKGAAAK